MRALLVIASLGVIACADRRVTPTALSKSPTLAEAQAWERGTGRPRDYRRSAAIHEQLCDDGRGDALACVYWLDALSMGRGVSRDHGLAASLGRRMCKAGQVHGCVLAQFLGPQRSSLGSPQTREEARVEALFQRAEQACLAGDVGACMAQLMLDAFVRRDELHDRKKVPAAACQLGLSFGCAELVSVASGCDRGDAFCLVTALERWRKESLHEPALAAYARLDEDCRAGDANACRGLPKREIPPAELCAGHDYDACAEASCGGPAKARVEQRRMAEDHDVEIRCDWEWKPGGLDEASPDCAAAATALAREPRLREELENICLEQRWSKDWVTCLTGSEAACQDDRESVVAAIRRVWPVLAPIAVPPACEWQERLFVLFAEMLHPEHSVDERREDALRLAQKTAECPPVR